MNVKFVKPRCQWFLCIQYMHSYSGPWGQFRKWDFVSFRKFVYFYALLIPPVTRLLLTGFNHYHEFRREQPMLHPAQVKAATALTNISYHNWQGWMLSHVLYQLIMHKLNNDHQHWCIQETKMGEFQWMKKLHGRGPPEIPSVWSLWVSNGTWGSNHTMNRLFGSLVLASGSRSSDPAWPADKERARTIIGMGWFFSPPKEGPILNRV